MSHPRRLNEAKPASHTWPATRRRDPSQPLDQCRSPVAHIHSNHFIQSPAISPRPSETADCQIITDVDEDYAEEKSKQKSKQTKKLHTNITQCHNLSY